MRLSERRVHDQRRNVWLTILQHLNASSREAHNNNTDHVTKVHQTLVSEMIGLMNRCHARHLCCVGRPQDHAAVKAEH